VIEKSWAGIDVHKKEGKKAGKAGKGEEADRGMLKPVCGKGGKVAPSKASYSCSAVKSTSPT
jgi:hypothetical protein